ncbi:MAG: DNA/RNA nuclease SfsA [Oscillospiraceae bacterium]|nr:DNA/RNA nuclease SfsA [Oscillospiraceae bacterium]
MEYANIKAATFLHRPNRFIAEVDLSGKTVISHVKNTGRCRELLIPGAPIYIQDFGEEHAGRKTRYDLIAVEKNGHLINMDAQAPNKVFAEWAMSQEDGCSWRGEVTWGSSRFDFAWQRGEERGFIEVKGVTLEQDGIALFPDAPTERGVKHLRELKRAVEEGLHGGVCFVVQMAEAKTFRPNDMTHPEFGTALRDAAQAGVELTARLCAVAPSSLVLGRTIPIEL